jgi:hypothetical protein
MLSKPVLLLLLLLLLLLQAMYHRVLRDTGALMGAAGIWYGMQVRTAQHSTAHNGNAWQCDVDEWQLYQ